MADTIPLIVTSIRQETDSVKSVFLQTADGTTLDYKAGQFITFLFSINNREIRRSYSFSSSPAFREPLCITIKRYPNGIISRWIHDTWKAGMIFNSLKPAGIFTIDYNPGVSRDIFLIAAGSGITPVFSLLKDILINEPTAHITLIYSNQSLSHAVFYND